LVSKELRLELGRFYSKLFNLRTMQFEPQIVLRSALFLELSPSVDARNIKLHIYQIQLDALEVWKLSENFASASAHFFTSASEKPSIALTLDAIGLGVGGEASPNADS